MCAYIYETNDSNDTEDGALTWFMLRPLQSEG